MKMTPAILLILACLTSVIEGRQCTSSEYCCGSIDVKFYGIEECSKCCDTGLAVEGIIAISIGIPVAIIVGLVLCCCFCPGCVLNNHRSRGHVFMVHRENQGYYDAAGNFVTTTPMTSVTVPSTHVHVHGQNPYPLPSVSGQFLTPPPAPGWQVQGQGQIMPTIPNGFNVNVPPPPYSPGYPTK